MKKVCPPARLQSMDKIKKQRSVSPSFSIAETFSVHHQVKKNIKITRCGLCQFCWFTLWHLQFEIYF